MAFTAKDLEAIDAQQIAKALSAPRLPDDEMITLEAVTMRKEGGRWVFHGQPFRTRRRDAHTIVGVLHPGGMPVRK